MTMYKSVVFVERNLKINISKALGYIGAMHSIFEI